MTAPKPSRADAVVTACVVLTKQGEPCGKGGQVGLPAGVCPECAIRIYRAVVAMAPADG